MWLYIFIILLIIGVGVFIYFKFFYGSNNKLENTSLDELEDSNLDDNPDSNKENDIDEKNSTESDENSNNQLTVNNLFDGSSENKKVNIYASYECGSIAGSLSNELIFSKNMDDKEKWLIHINDIKDNYICGYIQSVSKNKFWGINDSKLELVDSDTKVMFELIFGISNKSRNVCDVKVKDTGKYIELSKEGKLILVENLNKDNFKFKIIQVDE